MARVIVGGTATLTAIAPTSILLTAPAGKNVNIDYLHMAALAAVAAGGSVKITLGNGGTPVAWITAVDSVYAVSFHYPIVLPAGVGLAMTVSPAAAQTVEWSVAYNLV